MDYTTLEKINARKNQLADLVNSEGWKIYVAYLEAQEMAAKAHLYALDAQANTVLRASGMLAIIDAAKNWPRLQVQAFNQQIEKITSKPAAQRSGQ